MAINESLMPYKIKTIDFNTANGSVNGISASAGHIVILSIMTHNIGNDTIVPSQPGGVSIYIQRAGNKDYMYCYEDGSHANIPLKITYMIY